MNKKCSNCKNVFPLEEFYSAKDTLDKKGSWCKECHRKAGIVRYKKTTVEDKVRLKKYAKEWRENNREQYRYLSRISHERRRLRVLKHYGGEVPQCKCCGEKEIKFLSIDHINGGGLKHLRKIGRGSLMGWIIKKKYPKGFQILCHNCNFSKGHYGMCPHMKGKTT